MNTLQYSFLIWLLLTPIALGASWWSEPPYAHVGKKQSHSTANAKALRKQAKRTLNNEGLHKKSKFMSLEEAKKAKECYEVLERDDMMITMLERMIALASPEKPESVQESRKWFLELADAYTRQGDLKKAQQLYHQYVLLFPGASDIEYARYQEIMVNFWDILSIERDQQKTRTAIKLAQSFLKEFPSRSIYIASVHDTLKTCYTNIFHHELNVISHYITKYKYSYNEQPLIAATKRFEVLQQELFPQLMVYDLRFATLEKKVKKILAALSPKDNVPGTSEHASVPERIITAETRLSNLETLFSDCINVMHLTEPRSMSSRF